MPQAAAQTPPIRLITLGSLELTGPPPAARARVTAQPKRLALLAYLAARPAGTFVTRDRILATFWPELPAARGQGNLRNALYFLRRALGPGLIIPRANAISVSPRLVCDAALLLDGAAPDAEALLALYRGEFLDAFYITGAPDFERWVDRTRAALRARAAEVAWKLAAEAEKEGQWIAAAHYARRAADLSVDLEAATQRLIRLLLRAGDRAAALMEYQRLVGRLDQDFGIAPSPETAGLLAPIRLRQVDPAAPASGPAAPGMAGARSLAVLPFRNAGGKAGAYLATGLGEDLRTALARIRNVRIVSGTSVRQFGERPPTSMPAVRELLGVDLVLEGSAELREDRCRITVRLVDARDDRPLWAQDYDRPLSEIFEVQSDIALRVARALETELSPREHRRLRSPPTSDLRAWQFYLKGREVWSRRNPRDARRAAELFHQALAIDGRLALAWVGLADAWLARTATGTGSWRRAARAAGRAVDRALECDPDLGEARATLGLLHTFFDWNPAAARREYRRAVELSPGYAIGHQWFGNWLCAFGEVEEGLAELATAIRLDPISPAVSESLGLGLLHAGRHSDAQVQFHQTLALDPQYWRARIGLAMCRAIDGDVTAAAGELVQVWQSGGFGASRSEGRQAAKALQRGPLRALDYLTQALHARRAEGGSIRVMEIVLLAMQQREAEALTAMRAGRRQAWLPFLIWFAPMLDRLARHEQFRILCDEAGLLLPRWRDKTARGASR